MRLFEDQGIRKIGDLKNIVASTMSLERTFGISKWIFIHNVWIPVESFHIALRAFWMVEDSSVKSFLSAGRIFEYEYSE